MVQRALKQDEFLSQGYFVLLKEATGQEGQVNYSISVSYKKAGLHKRILYLCFILHKEKFFKI